MLKINQKTMGIQFCDDCGNLLDESINDEVKCDVCGRLCKSTVPPPPPNPPPPFSTSILSKSDIGIFFWGGGRAPKTDTISSQTTTSTSRSNNFPSALRTRLRSTTQKVTAQDIANTRRIAKECPGCHVEEMAWSEAQLRGADEGSTIFYHCLDCGYR